jgi:hypothetical protein
MEDSFVDLLQSLTNDTEPVDPVRLAELSDLDSERLENFAVTWEALSADQRNALLEELGSLADAQIELTFEAINRFALDDPESTVRQQAIENLWESEDPKLARRFTNLLNNDPSPEVRGAAGKALGVFVFLAETRELEQAIRHEMEESLVAGARSDSNSDVRDLCLRSLGYSSRSEVPELIGEAIDAQSESRIASALRAMARSANSVWEENVMARLHDGSPTIRLEAVRAAGEIEIRAAVSDLIELLEDVDEAIRRAAMWSLGQIGGPKATEALTSLAEQELGEREQETLRDAIDNLVFVEGALDLFSLDQDDPQDLLA